MKYDPKKPYAINVDVYRVSVAVCHTRKAFRRVVPKSEHRLPKDCEAYSYPCPHRGPVIYYLLPSSPGVLAHECLHAATDILAVRGVGIRTDDHEALAYLLTYLVDEIHRASLSYLKRPKT